MQTLNSFTAHGVTLNTNQEFVSNNLVIIIKEIFEIDGCTYIALHLPNNSMNANIINEETKEIEITLPINRSFVLAEHFILKNTHLFS